MHVTNHVLAGGPHVKSSLVTTKGIQCNLDQSINATVWDGGIKYRRPGDSAAGAVGSMAQHGMQCDGGKRRSERCTTWLAQDRASAGDCSVHRRTLACCTTFEQCSPLQHASDHSTHSRTCDRSAHSRTSGCCTTTLSIVRIGSSPNRRSAMAVSGSCSCSREVEGRGGC